MPHSNFRAEEVFKNFTSMYNVSDSDRIKIDYTLDSREFEGEWRYVGFLLDLKVALWRDTIRGKFNYEWETDQVGTFFIKAINRIAQAYGSYDYPDECRDKAIESVKKLFKLPETDSTYLVDIAYIYSSMDFRHFTKNYTHHAIPSPPSLVDLNTEFVSCFAYIENLHNVSITKKEPLFDDREEDDMNHNKESPCNGETIIPQCKAYCQWHHNVIVPMSKKDLISIAKYGIPQRKILREQVDWEFNMAKAMFGDDHIRNLTGWLGPTTSAITFCHRKDEGYTGDYFSEHVKLCNDFFITPSDIGMVFTKHLDLDDVMKIDEDYEDVFEPRSSYRTPNSEIEGGTIWSKMTLVLDVNAVTAMSQTYPKHPTVTPGELQIQVHQDTDLAKMILESSYDHLSEPLTLQAGHEYHIDVHPYGQISTREFRNLNQDQRNCKLKQEVDQHGIFKIYTQKNCKYSCLVELAIKECQCKPWDFISNITDIQECDIFGRTCFFDAMNMLTKSPKSLCIHCIKECDFIKFKKELTGMKLIDTWTNKYFSMAGKESGSRALWDYLMDENMTIIDKGFRNLYNRFPGEKFEGYPAKKFGDLIVVHLKFKKPEVNIISPKYTIFDMIGNFGGQFGLFEQVTGASFLGLINIVILIFKLIISVPRRNRN